MLGTDHSWDTTCPSPENPCMCICHREGRECFECKIGKHKPNNLSKEE